MEVRTWAVLPIADARFGVQGSTPGATDANFSSWVDNAWPCAASFSVKSLWL